jgi:prevent-host-death family protein
MWTRMVSAMCYGVDMRVGIRELKQHASSVIRRVVSGEPVEVTDRGRLVARIVPIEAAQPYDRMVADGEITVGNGRWAEIDPLPPLPGRSLSDALAELRADER